ncbi:MAG: phage virion morphogenesis protein [Zoogloeaceae bacterium]|jgi:phage gpG-like protein|nr:phage virion morphogenesis protein [Zoogloeaceae bacterium]
MSGNRIIVECNSRKVLDVLRELTNSMTPAELYAPMWKIGDALAESTKKRFDTSTDPDGNPWKPLKEDKKGKPVTVLARLRKILNAGDNPARAGNKPLLETGRLKDSITVEVTDGGAGVEVGTNRFQDDWEGGAAVHQFGSEKRNIPARPFLGISKTDETMVLDILNRFIEDHARMR